MHPQVRKLIDTAAAGARGDEADKQTILKAFVNSAFAKQGIGELVAEEGHRQAGFVGEMQGQALVVSPCLFSNQFTLPSPVGRHATPPRIRSRSSSSRFAS